MVKYFILVKSKGSKIWKGAIPARSGRSKSEIVKSIRRNLKSGFVAKVISESELKARLRRASPKAVRRAKPRRVRMMNRRRTMRRQRRR